jgi:hypothetical protein
VVLRLGFWKLEVNGAVVFAEWYCDKKYAGNFLDTEEAD